MLKLRQQIAAGMLTAVVGVMSFSAYAQATQGAQKAAPATQSQDARGHGPQGRGAPSPEQIAKFKERFEKRLSVFHDTLQLSSAQEPAWNAFVARIRPVPPAARAARPATEPTAVEHLQHQVDRLKQHEAVLTARLAAVKDFYAVLTPSQQKVFNIETARMQHEWKHGGHRGHGGHGGHDGRGFGDQRGGDHGPRSDGRGPGGDRGADAGPRGK